MLHSFNLRSNSSIKSAGTICSTTHDIRSVFRWSSTAPVCFLISSPRKRKLCNKHQAFTNHTHTHGGLSLMQRVRKKGNQNSFQRCFGAACAHTAHTHTAHGSWWEITQEKQFPVRRLRLVFRNRLYKHQFCVKITKRIRSILSPLSMPAASS